MLIDKSQKSYTVVDELKNLVAATQYVATDETYDALWRAVRHRKDTKWAKETLTGIRNGMASLPRLSKTEQVEALIELLEEALL